MGFLAMPLTLGVYMTQLKFNTAHLDADAAAAAVADAWCGQALSYNEKGFVHNFPIAPRHQM